MGKEPIDLLVLGASQVATPVDPGGPCKGRRQGTLRLIQKGAVAIRKGLVVETGPTPELRRRYATRQTLDARGRLVTPGLVDPHTHVVYAGSRAHEFELRAGGMRYEEISQSGGGILSTVRATRSAGVARLALASLPRLARMLRCGTTSAEIKSGYALNLDGELALLRAIRRLAAAQPISLVPTFLGAHAVPREFAGRREAFVDLIVERALPRVAREGLARYCDVFCEPGFFTPAESRRVLLAARRYGLEAKIHADEFTRSGGARLAADLGAASADHLGAISPKDVEALAGSPTVAVLLPGTMYFLNKPQRPPARSLIRAGVAVAIGTDCNPGTNMCWSMPMAMNQSCVMLSMTPAEALTAATLNAAYACGLGRAAGSLDAGKWADLAIWDCPDYRFLSYEYGATLARTVIKRGRVAWQAHD